MVAAVGFVILNSIGTLLKMKYRTAADIVDAIFELILDIRKLENSLERQIIGSADSSDSCGKNPWATGSAVSRHHWNCFNKMIGNLEATMDGRDYVSPDQSAGKCRETSSLGPEVGANVLLCSVDVETTGQHRETAGSGDGPAVVDPASRELGGLGDCPDDRGS